MCRDVTSELKASRISQLPGSPGNSADRHLAIIVNAAGTGTTFGETQWSIFEHEPHLQAIDNSVGRGHSFIRIGGEIAMGSI